MLKINQWIYFLSIITISIYILIIYFRNRKSKLKILVGSSQILGARNEQEDNYSVINSENDKSHLSLDDTSSLLYPSDCNISKMLFDSTLFFIL